VLPEVVKESRNFFRLLEPCIAKVVVPAVRKDASLAHITVKFEFFERQALNLLYQFSLLLGRQDVC
jgi:hypothetical protein